MLHPAPWAWTWSQGCADSSASGFPTRARPSVAIFGRFGMAHSDYSRWSPSPTGRWVPNYRLGLPKLGAGSDAHGPRLRLDYAPLGARTYSAHRVPHSRHLGLPLAARPGKGAVTFAAVAYPFLA